MTALKVDGVSKRFEDGFLALADIDLAVAQGEFVTLLGPSGCGKTTLLKTIAGFHAPTAGRIEIDGVDVSQDPPERRDTAMCFQSYALFPHLSVADNIDFGPRQKRVARPERAARLAELLRQVDLEAHKDKLPNKLSGGQQQRVALARALAMRPKLVLFDEPLSNLDAKLREQVRIEIRALQRDLGFTAIYVTHDQSEALAMSDRVVVMRAGRIEQIGGPEAIYDRPETVFVAEFIGAANVTPFAPGLPGNLVSTPLGAIAADDRPDPHATHLSWRPEDAVLLTDATAEAEAVRGDEALGVVTGRVTARAFQGPWVELHIAADGADGALPAQRVHVARTPHQVGDRIAFRLPPSKIRFLRDAGAAA